MTQPDQIQARNAAIDMLEERTAKALQLISPVPTTVVEGVGYTRSLTDVATLRYCRVCTPAPEVFTCPVCDWSTQDRWRLKLHIDLEPRWCQERGAKKARVWASKT